MKPEARLEVASNSRHQAEAYLNKSNFGRSFAHYLVALNLCPEWKLELKLKFSSTLCSWGAELETQKRFKDLFHCYEQALEVYPDNEEILNNLGAHLYRLDHVREASHYFRKALIIDPDFLPARRNLQTVSNSVVERWHFRMLNDRLRNEAFREALFKKVKQKFDTVLDIGTGTGILSMFAANSGAQAVFACDVSPTMFQIATDVLQANNLSSKVHLLNKISHDLKIPKDLPERVSLVVTETMDCGLLGEHVLSTLSDAWKRLLLPPCDGFCSKKRKATPELKESCDGNENKNKVKEEVNEIWNRCFWRYPPGGSTLGHGIVIPFGAAVCLAGIECHNLSLRYSLLSKSCVHLHLNMPGVVTATTINGHGGEEDPYDAEDIANIPGGFRYLVDPKEAIYVNFNDPEEIDDRLSGNFPQETLEVKITSSGRLDAVAAWFILDVDEDIKLITAPGKGSCWEQALYPLYPPVDVNEGQTLEYVITYSGKKLSMTARIIEDKKCVVTKEPSLSLVNEVNKHVDKEKMDNPSEGNLVLSENQNLFACNIETEEAIPENKASSKDSESVMFDNTSTEHSRKSVVPGIISSSEVKNLYLSEKSIAFLNNNLWIDTIIAAAKTVASGAKRDAILDMNPFPIFGLMMLKLEGTKSLVWCSNTSGSLRAEEERTLFEIASFNGIEAHRIKCESDDSLHGEFDIIFCDLIDPEGELQELIVGKLPSLLQMLKSSGILMPKRIRVKAQLLFSEWLTKMSKVLSDENVCNYKIADLMNIYKVPQHLDLDMNALTKDACSNPIEALELDVISLAASNPVKSSRIIDMEVINDCHVNAVAHWYEEEILEDLWVSSYGTDSHLKQAATIFPLELDVKGKEKVSIKITQHQGILYFQLNETVLQSDGTVEDFEKKLNI